jgi:hypothetical protein
VARFLLTEYVKLVKLLSPLQGNPDMEINGIAHIQFTVNDQLPLRYMPGYEAYPA